MELTRAGARAGSLITNQQATDYRTQNDKLKALRSALRCHCSNLLPWPLRCGNNGKTLAHIFTTIATKDQGAYAQISGPRNRNCDRMPRGEGQWISGSVAERACRAPCAAALAAPMRLLSRVAYKGADVYRMGMAAIANGYTGLPRAAPLTPGASTAPCTSRIFCC
jgi:hypothetical protein